MNAWDNIGFGDLKLIQNQEGFKYGLDAVLLGAMASRDSGSRIMDIGTGTGIIPLILSHKTEAVVIMGLEVQEIQYELAVENVKLNGLENRLRMLQGNVKDVGVEARFASLLGTFDVVTCNPPYMEEGRGLKNPLDAKAISRHEILGNLKDFIHAASLLLKSGGALYMVHRPRRLADIICTAREEALEPKVMKMAKGKADDEPNIVLMKFVKDGGRELRILPELVIRNEDGSFTRDYLDYING